MFGTKGAKKNGGSRCCNQFTSWTLGVFEIGLCILIIGTVFWHLTDYDVTVDLSYQCLLGTDPDSNGLCIYSYVVAGVGMFLSLVLMVAACALTEKWARAAHHLSWSLALVGILWYVVAAIIVSQKVKTANDDNDYNTKWRNGVAVTMWVLAILFAVRLLVGIILASCDCCGRKRAKKDALKDKAQGAEGDKSKQDNKEADKSKKMAEKDVEAGTPSDAKVQSDTVQAPDQAPVIPTVDTDGANVAAAAAVGAATGAAVVAVPTAVALAAGGGDADKKAENGVPGDGVTAGLTGSAQTMPPVVPAAVSSMRRTVENSSKSMAAAVDTAKV